VIADKTNAMRVLDAHHVAYDAYAFSPDVHSTPDIASAIGVPANEIFKTLVVLRSAGKPLLVMVPGDRQLDLRRLAAAVGAKKLQMAPHRDAERITGLRVGGISALALLNRGFDI
jgi:Cys-tRNA(Pro)/Cys-tRNA(Cys) deacylase